MAYNKLKGSKMSVLPLLNRHGKEIYSFQEIVNITKMDVINARKVLHELERSGRLVRIENGKYSVGLDILSKLASAIGYHIDIVPYQM